jgi:hypothetical protein
MSDSTVGPQPDGETSAPGVERRAVSRALLRDRPLIHLLIKPSFFSVRAFVHDVGKAGIAFLVNQPLKPGSRVAFQLRNDRRGNTRIQSARIVHLASHPGGQWVVGCELSPPLAEEDLHYLASCR